MKTTWIILLFLGASFALIGWVISYQDPSVLPTQSDAIMVSSSSVPQNTYRKYDIDSQRDCSIQAQKTINNFEEHVNTSIKGINLGQIFEQINHYDEIRSKCFVLMDNIREPDSKILFDAYQNTRIATCDPDNNLMGKASFLGNIHDGTNYMSYASCMVYVNQRMND